MKCKWCKNVATQGGELPQNARGLQYWPACDFHANKIEKLGLTPISVEEIATIQKREAKEAARK